MKKFLAIALAAVCVLSLAACSQTSTETTAAVTAAETTTAAAATEAAATGTIDIEAINEIVANLTAVEPDILGTVAKLGDYKGLEISTTEPTVITEAEALDYIDQYILPSFTEEADVIENGDTANINYVGKKDGVAFEGGTADGYDLVIGSGSFIEGFESGLIGVKKGETVDLNLTFPENYQAKDLAGQAVVFTVTVNSIKRPAALSDDIAAQVDETCKTAADLVNLTIDNLQQQADLAAKQELYYNAVEKVLENSDIEAAAEAIEYTTNNFVKNYAASTELYGLDLGTLLSYYGTSYEDFVASYNDYSIDSVKQRVVLREIAKLENLQVTDAEREAFAKDYGYTLETIKSIVDPDLFEELVLEDMANKFIIDNSTVTYTKTEE